MLILDLSNTKVVSRVSKQLGDLRPVNRYGYIRATSPERWLLILDLISGSSPKTWLSTFRSNIKAVSQDVAIDLKSANTSIVCREMAINLRPNTKVVSQDTAITLRYV